MNCAFPLLFTNGGYVGEKGDHPPPARELAHYMKYCDGRFQRCQDFVLYLNNLRTRRGVAQNVARVRADQAAKIMETIQSEDFVRNLSDAVDAQKAKQPLTRDQQSAVDFARTNIKMSFKNLPFTVGDSAIGVFHLHSLMRCLGLPSFFITVTPTTTDSKMGTILSIAMSDIRSFPGILECPTEKMSYGFRLERSFACPGAGAMFYKRSVENIIKILFNHEINPSSSMASRRRGPGVFGKVMEIFLATEAQSRSGLHCHICVFCQAGPDVLMEMARTGRLQEVLDFVGETLVTDCNKEFFEEREQLWARKEFIEAAGLCPGVVFEENPYSFERLVELTLQRYNMHLDHKQTCYKYGEIGRAHV